MEESKMSRSLNRATLIGNLGADPEVRTVGTGNRVAHFSLATSRSWKDAEGTPHQRTDWHRVVVWGARVEMVEQYLRKGERVYVEGEIQNRSYEDGEGTTRHVTEINARELLLLGGRDHAAERPADPASEEPPRNEPGKQPARSRRTPPVAARSAFKDDDLPF
jgi:single-strand DNA-binding protein